MSDSNLRSIDKSFLGHTILATDCNYFTDFEQRKVVVILYHSEYVVATVCGLLTSAQPFPTPRSSSVSTIWLFLTSEQMQLFVQNYTIVKTRNNAAQIIRKRASAELFYKQRSAWKCLFWCLHWTQSQARTYFVRGLQKQKSVSKIHLQWSCLFSPCLEACGNDIWLQVLIWRHAPLINKDN